MRLEFEPEAFEALQYWAGTYLISTSQARPIKQITWEFAWKAGVGGGAPRGRHPSSPRSAGTEPWDFSVWMLAPDRDSPCIFW